MQISIPYELNRDFESNTEHEIEFIAAPILHYADVPIEDKEGVFSGKITKERKIPIKVMSQEVGKSQWEFKVLVPDGEAYSFIVIGEFAPPTVSINKGEIYFGVLKRK